MAITVKETKNDVTVNAKLGATDFLTRINSGIKEVTGDEPVSLGGKDAGFNPYEFLASALSMCTAVTLRMYAQRKAMDLGEINVSVHLSNNVIDKVASFTKTISFENKGLSENELVRLKAIAESCPVNRLLNNTIVVNTNLQGE